MLTALPAGAQPAKQPNIILILADDLGYGDLGCFGHPTIRTPSLDRLAAEGMKLTQFYAAASICTPSRAALLTGRYPLRSGLTHVLFPDSEGGLQEEEVTIAEVLREAGYATACIGKWHLGRQARYLPTNHGFDYYFGIPYSNDMSPMNPDYVGVPITPLIRNLAVTNKEEPDQRYLTKWYTDESIRFIRQQARKRPFFLYLAHSMPHIPLYASERFRGKSPRGLYGDVVEELDWSCGELLKALKEQGIEDDTLVVFTSDNGPWLQKELDGGSSGLLREGKASSWEGGFRVPAIFRWPGCIRAGSTSTAVATMMDLFTTFTKLGAGQVPADRIIDGGDLLPVLLGADTRQETPFLYYYYEEPWAVRVGPWKMHLKTSRSWECGKVGRMADYLAQSASALQSRERSVGKTQCFQGASGDRAKTSRLDGTS